MSERWTQEQADAMAYSLRDVTLQLNTVSAELTAALASLKHKDEQIREARQGFVAEIDGMIRVLGNCDRGGPPHYNTPYCINWRPGGSK